MRCRVRARNGFVFLVFLDPPNGSEAFKNQEFPKVGTLQKWVRLVKLPLPPMGNYYDALF